MLLLIALLPCLQQVVSEPSEAPQLTFLVLGDWGGKPSAPYTTPAEVDLAKVMGSKAAEIGSQFTLALGDNFYDKGVKNVEDARFKETFEVSCVIRPYLIDFMFHGFPSENCDPGGG